MSKTKADLENDIRKMKEVIAGFKEPVTSSEASYQALARKLLAQAEGYVGLLDIVDGPTRIQGKHYPHGIRSNLINYNK